MGRGSLHAIHEALCVREDDVMEEGRWVHVLAGRVGWLAGGRRRPGKNLNAVFIYI